jgi:hypothetical protein
MIDREEARRLFEVFMDAMEREQAVNSDEARAAAQAAVLAAAAALDRATGKTDLLRRRMVVEARGLSLGANVHAADFERFARDCVDGTPSGQIRLRQALARHAMDSAMVITDRWAGVLAGQMLQTAEGRNGPLDGPVRAGGVDPHAGAADAIRNKIVTAAGYTAGVEFGNGVIPRTFWRRFEVVQNALAAQGRRTGHKTPDTRATTIRDWCERGGPLSNLFRNARKEGAGAAAPDPSRMIR